MLDLRRDPFDRLVLTLDGVPYRGVVPVRAFPITAPDDGISLVGVDGHELAWIERLDALPDAARALVAAALAGREFTPNIVRIRSVSGYTTPCTWRVDTDRGETSFVLKSEESVRRLSPASLLIADSHGAQFVVRDLASLDRESRRMLDRFL